MVLVAGELDVTYEGQAPVRLVPGTYAYGPAGGRRRPLRQRCPCVLFIAFESAVERRALP